MEKREMGGGKLESRRTSEGEVAIVDEEGGTDRAGKFGAAARGGENEGETVAVAVE